MKFKKGDEIIVTTGKDKGRKGKIEQVLSAESSVVVAGVNMYKRHMKRRDEKTPGGIVEKPRPLASGKFALICPKCGKQTRIGYLVTGNEKERICRKCGQKV
jgi:large subunit ribosomal protein L24